MVSGILCGNKGIYNIWRYFIVIYKGSVLNKKITQNSIIFWDYLGGNVAPGVFQLFESGHWTKKFEADKGENGYKEDNDKEKNSPKPLAKFLDRYKIFILHGAIIQYAVKLKIIIF